VTASRFLPRLVLAAGLALAGCADNPSDSTPRAPGVLLIPIDMSLEAAARDAVAGDTLQFVSSVTVANTVVFHEEQTPLLLRGFRNQTWITGTMGDRPILSFLSPRAGTRITQMAFSGGSAGLDLVGPGAVAVDECRFDTGASQIRGSGNGLTVDVSHTLMRNAGAFSLDMGGDAVLRAVSTSIDAAGDCGIRLQGSAVAYVAGCIIWRSANFGIACLGTGGLADSSGCNDIHQSATGSYTGCAPPSSDFSLPPLFCDPDDGDYTIDELSPCAPLNSGGCGLIGAETAVDCAAP
jgi:hypothetical protein